MRQFELSVEKMPEEPSKKGNTAIAMAGIGSEMVGATIFGVAMDYILNTLPLFTALFTIAGLPLAMWHLFAWLKARGLP